MSADRYTIEIDGERVSVFVGLVRVICQRLDVYTVGAIRQQARDIAALKDALADEVTANEAFRKAGGARDDEDMPTFCARLIAERDKYRGQLFDCELALKMEHDLLCEKRAELAAAVAERDLLGYYRSEFEPIWDGLQDALEGERQINNYGLGESEVECVRRVLRERDILRARLSAIDSAPVVASVGIDTLGKPRALYFPPPHRSAFAAKIDEVGGWTIKELIAKPAKD